ncbi:hypothetical protein PbDSM24746_36170 [Paenibacillus macerans]|nr:hypothetical protein PbDSM24746_36170 [Paenibacillus macerans]GBK69926.1 hypothetical protein PbJCM17693_36340 [Paenibacillus macerans]
MVIFYYREPKIVKHFIQKNQIIYKLPLYCEKRMYEPQKWGGGLFVEMYEFGVGGPSGLRMCGVLQNSSDKCGQL